MGKIVLEGITWGHSRGIMPLLAIAQRYHELYPDVEIRWKKRTLQEFADFPIEELTKKYDLLIIDHPWVGCAAATNCVLPLEQYLSKEYLDDQQTHSVGASHTSYNYGGSQWALAIDASTPAASYRADLLEKNHQRIPATWEEVIDLATQGKVAVPAIPIDILMNFYSFCLVLGKEPFSTETDVIDVETGVQAINTMKQLYTVVNKEMFGFNPIDVAERMSSTNDYWYCPFSYTYSNYSRKGFADYLLTYDDVVSVNNKPLRTTIGGTGISVSAFSQHPEEAVRFAALANSPECQKSIYVQHGGQPGHRSAWKDELANKLTNDFFVKMLPVMDNGYMRPRYNGYLFFQDHAGDPLQQCLLNDSSPEEALEAMNRIYIESKQREKIIASV